MSQVLLLESNPVDKLFANPCRPYIRDVEYSSDGVTKPQFRRTVLILLAYIHYVLDLLFESINAQHIPNIMTRGMLLLKLFKKAAAVVFIVDPSVLLDNVSRRLLRGMAEMDLTFERL